MQFWYLIGLFYLSEANSVKSINGKKYLECVKGICEDKTEREIQFIFDQPEIMFLNEKISSELEEAHRVNIR